MDALSAPIFEVRQDCDWFKEVSESRERGAAFFREINKTHFKDNGFAYYNEEKFGVSRDSKDYEVYQNELKKHPDKNGIHEFKKTSKHYKYFKEKLKGIEHNVSPFKTHDVFGMNNIRYKQWLDNRWFFEVKDKDLVTNQYALENEIREVPYQEYLSLLQKIVAEMEESNNA